MQFQVNAHKRDTQGTGASRRLRRTGKVPGIVYGEGQTALAIEMDHQELLLGLRHEAFHSSVLELILDGQKQPVLLRDVQVHPVRRQILHIDFQRIDPKHKIHVKVPFHFVNAESCPGVKLRGGVVNHVMTEADVACLPSSLPGFIEVDLAGLDSGQSLHLSHIKLPAGVEFTQLVRGEDPTVVTVAGPKAEEESAAEAPPPAEAGGTPAAS